MRMRAHDEGSSASENINKSRVGFGVANAQALSGTLSASPDTWFSIDPIDRLLFDRSVSNPDAKRA